MKRLSIFLISSAILCLSQAALAGTVNNPGTYAFDLPGPAHQSYFKTAHGNLINESGNTGSITDVLEGDIDSSGNWTESLTAFPHTIGGAGDAGFTIGGQEVTAQLVVESTSTGVFFTDAASDITMSWSVHLHYAWSGTGSPCNSPSFSLNMDTSSTVTYGGNNYTGTPYNSSTGAFVIIGTGTIPNVSGTTCGGSLNQQTINTNMSGSALFLLYLTSEGIIS